MYWMRSQSGHSYMNYSQKHNLLVDSKYFTKYILNVVFLYISIGYFCYHKLKMRKKERNVNNKLKANMTKKGERNNVFVRDLIYN